MIESIRRSAVAPMLRGHAPAPRLRNASLFMNDARCEFGTFQLPGVGDHSKIRFSVFFPGASMYQSHPEISGYGDPKIRSIHVVGSFQAHLGQQEGALTDGNEMTPASHPSGKGAAWEWTTPVELPAGFHEYRYGRRLRHRYPAPAHDLSPLGSGFGGH